MGALINSICLQENTIYWLQIEASSAKSIEIHRIVETPLPFIINYDNVQKYTTALDIVRHLSSVAATHELDFTNVRMTIPAKFGLVKKILVDDAIPESEYPAFVRQELGYVLTPSIQDYYIYQPEYSNVANNLRELLAVVVRKDLFRYIRQIGREANMTIEEINLNCFRIDELYRRFFPDLVGTALLANFTERGIEITLSDELNFIDYDFVPYTSGLLGVDTLDLNKIAGSFSAAINDFRQPAMPGAPSRMISRILVYGPALNHDWLGTLQEHSDIPIAILNATETPGWQVDVSVPKFNPRTAYRYTEPLANIF